MEVCIFIHTYTHKYRASFPEREVCHTAVKVQVSDKNKPLKPQKQLCIISCVKAI